MNFLQKQLSNRIKIMEKILAESDIYGCDIKIRNGIGDTDWFTIQDEQLKHLIQTYKNRLNDLNTNK